MQRGRSQYTPRSGEGSSERRVCLGAVVALQRCGYLRVHGLHEGAEGVPSAVALGTHVGRADRSQPRGLIFDRG